jgi:hypothetical protein
MPRNPVGLFFGVFYFGGLTMTERTGKAIGLALIGTGLIWLATMTPDIVRAGYATFQNIQHQRGK